MISHIVRFAPSPTGDLHLGHIYSALYGWQACGQKPAQFLLRIDDLDHSRCRAEFVARHCDDLQWMGIAWDKAPLYQSQRLHRYQAALSFLQERGLVYPCFLSRREVNEILSAPQEETGLRDALSEAEKQSRQEKGTEPAWRLDITKIAQTLPSLHWIDVQKGEQLVDITSLGAPVIARRDIGASYDLAVVLDDFDSGVSLVTRGDDLFAQTNLHRLLQHLLGLPTPLYDHHKLICDEDGKRLAKRDDARSLTHYRQAGYDRGDILTLLGLT